MDRVRARDDLHIGYVDSLTGVYAREFGLLALQHEVDRAHRSGQSFVLACITVDGLAEINGAAGQAAGDDVLRAVGAHLRSSVRSYDPIVRIGDDEFIWGFTDLDLAGAAQRVQVIETALADDDADAAISSGLAQLGPDEDLEALIARGSELLELGRR